MAAQAQDHLAHPGADLLSAAERGDARAVERLLKGGAPLDWQDARGRTALMAATQANHVAIAQRLIQAGSDVNQRDETMLSPYLCAGANGFDAIFRATMDGGADLRSLNRFGASPLLPAAEKGYLRTVQLCLDAGLAVDHVNGLGWTPLLEAVILGDGGRLFADVVATLSGALNKAVKDPKYVETVTRRGSQQADASPAYFTGHLERERQRVERTVVKSALKLD